MGGAAVVQEGGSEFESGCRYIQLTNMNGYCNFNNIRTCRREQTGSGPANNNT